MELWEHVLSYVTERRSKKKAAPAVTQLLYLQQVGCSSDLCSFRSQPWISGTQPFSWYRLCHQMLDCQDTTCLVAECLIGRKNLLKEWAFFGIETILDNFDTTFDRERQIGMLSQFVKSTGWT